MSMERKRQDDSGRKFKGRGNAETMEQDSSERYKGSIFNRLDREPKEGPIKSVEGWIIFVRNVHEEATEEDITDAFSNFGTIKNLQMPLDRRTGFVKGYALVEYDEKEQAERAINVMNTSLLFKKPLMVDWSFAIEKRRK